MSLSYDSSTKTWNISYEKTDLPILNTVSITVPVEVMTDPGGPKPVDVGGGDYVYTGILDDNGNWAGPTFVTVDKTATVDIDGGYCDVIHELEAAGIPNPRPWDN